VRRLVVVGSVNVDLVVRVARLPAPGETVAGGSFERHHGGKGGNQAVAAARALAGGPNDGAVAFVGAVGADDDGEAASDALARERIDLTGLARLDSAATGVALIVVDAQGENQIAVANGANADVAPADVARATRRLLRDGGVLLASLEVPVPAVAAALQAARDSGATTVLNPAPAVPDASAVLLLADVVTPNEAEARVLEMDRMRAGPAACITRGARGVRLRRPGVADVELPAARVTARDATGAGDTFSGVLAAALLEGRPLEAAARWAVAAAGVAVTVVGARAGMPTRPAIEAAAR
jgi:ribokinase